MAAALVVNSIIAGLPNLQAFFFSVYNYSTSLDMIARFYDYPLEKFKENSIMPKNLSFSFKDVKFEPNYHFNFSFQEGTKNLIFVKSFSSVFHFYEGLLGYGDNVSGEVRYDNLLLEDLDIQQIRNHIQMIAHDQFFAGTVMENITGLNPEMKFTNTEIMEALNRVGLLEKIQDLPERLETQIRPNGYPFTKSQILAIQIARSILTKPRILFVTPDFEQISTFKRKLIYHELLDPKNQWTLLFFTQRYYKGSFDRYVVLERSNFKELSGEADVLKEIENV